MGLPDEVQWRIDVMFRVQELADRIYGAEHDLSLVLTTLAEAMSSRHEHAFGIQMMEANPDISEIDGPSSTPTQALLMDLASFASERGLSETHEALMEISIALAYDNIRAQAVVARHFIQHMRVARLVGKYAVHV